MKQVSERIIMGIDPGTIIMGYGLLRVRGQEADLLALGTIHLNKFDNHYLRLRRIFDRVQGSSMSTIPMSSLSRHPSSARMYRVCSSWDVPKGWPWPQP